jgi:hypothetical protein
MQIKYQDGSVAHVANEIGRALIAAKLAEEIIPEVKKPTPNMSWAARRGNRIDDCEEPPFILSSCSTCGHKGMTTGPTAGITTQIRHCGTIDVVPPHIGKQFQELRRPFDAAYAAAKRKVELAAKFKAGR